jgi:hypothetical protein
MRILNNIACNICLNGRLTFNSNSIEFRFSKIELKFGNSIMKMHMLILLFMYRWGGERNKLVRLGI